MKSFFLFFIFFISITASVITLPGCKTQQKTSSSKDTDALNTNGISKKDGKSIESEQKYIEASKMEILGDHQQALNLFEECSKGNPNNDAVYYEMAKIYFEQKDYNSCLSSIKISVRLNPSNKWYEELYAETLDKTGNQKDAAKVYEGLVKTYPENIDYYFDWAFFLASSNQLQEAINVYNHIEEKTGIEEQVSTEKERLYLKMGKPDKAAEELQKLAVVFPTEPKYLAMLADLYSASGMKDKAMETLQKLSVLDPNNPNAQLALADYYRRNGEDDKSFESLKKVFLFPDMNIDMEVQILVGYLPFLTTNEKRKSEALELGNILTTVHPTDPKSFAMYGDILSQVDKYEEALKQYQLSIKLDNGKFLVWQQALSIEANLLLNDSLIHDSNRCKELFPDQVLPYYFSGVANLQKKNFNDAVKSLRKAVTIGREDKKFMSQLYASLGDAYNGLKNYNSSDSSYDMSLVFDTDNIYTLNNYAYYLSIRGERLDKAEKMAEKAVNADTTNGNNLDTYAWVLYKLKRYSDAKTWLEKAFKNGAENNGTILEHYGDTLYQLGNLNGALEYWQKAKANKVESETIDRKIADKKIYE